MTTRSGGGTARTTCCWISPNGTQEQPRAELEPRQQLRPAPAPSPATRARGSDSCGSGRTATRQPRRIIRHAATGESMPPESRQTTRPLDADRQPAGAALLAEEVERLVGERLDVDRQLGMRESTVQSRASLIRPPTSRSISGDVSGKRLSARRADTPERRRSSCRRVARGSPRRSRRHRAPPGRPARNCRRRTRATTVAHHAPSPRRRRGRLDAPHQHADRLDVEVRQRRAQIADQPRHEPRAVPPLRAISR